jgi:predicted lipoprotein with Yx(FWY)xxD motif
MLMFTKTVGQPVSRWLAVAMIGATGLGVAACSSSSKPSSVQTTPPAGQSTAGDSTSGQSTSGATVSATNVPGAGTVLVNGSGQTLYLLSSEQGGKLTCTSAPCTSAWPPLALPAGTTAATAGSGVQSSLLGTAKAPDGAMEVTYNSYPLYTFKGDSGPGMAKGMGLSSFGGTWYPIDTSGSAVKTAPAAAPAPAPVTKAPASGGGGGGYSY